MTRTMQQTCCGSRREIFHMFWLGRLFYCRVFRQEFILNWIGCGGHSFAATYSCFTGVLHLKDFVILGFAWKRVLHSWWTSEKNNMRTVLRLCVWLLYFVGFFFQSSTAWITVLRSDKQALCEGAGVFFYFAFFRDVFSFAFDSLKWSNEREEEEKGLYHHDDHSYSQQQQKQEQRLRFWRNTILFSA